MLEFKSFEFPLPARRSADLPVTPGAVRYDEMGNAVLLHFSPGRFLAPQPGAALEGALQEYAAAGEGALFDVTGKWQRLSILKSEESRILAAAFDAAQVLSDRDCAAVSVFDCPSVVVRCPIGLQIWVPASYFRYLCELIDGIRHPLLENGP